MYSRLSQFALPYTRSVWWGKKRLGIRRNLFGTLGFLRVYDRLYWKDGFHLNVMLYRRRYVLLFAGRKEWEA